MCTLESVTSTTSDGSDLEERIKLLKLQLQQKKEEMKRFQTEQKRKKKEILRQQEEQLKRKLEVSGCFDTVGLYQIIIFTMLYGCSVFSSLSD